ncbi:MAG: 50S ribosomal protein L6 [Gammaproteobacteria bacterium]|nr:50S ribosomal protein L6 [Gammaproteobacteria bacterium]
MSRIAKKPVDIPSGVEVKIGEGSVVVKGPKGAMAMDIHPRVQVRQDENKLLFDVKRRDLYAMAGSMRSLVGNMVVGVSEGFERKLEMVGIGYRAQLKSGTLQLTLGYSHPVEYPVPQGITITTPSQTQIVVQGIDKQKVGQVAAEIRSFRPPEPYKGKGVKYADENILRKEAKKK